MRNASAVASSDLLSSVMAPNCAGTYLYVVVDSLGVQFGARGLSVEVTYAGDRAQQPRHDREWNVGGVRLGPHGKDFHPPPCGDSRELSGEAALTDPRRTGESHHRAAT